MENKCKRFLSLLLALVMVIGLMPMGHVHAEESADNTINLTLGGEPYTIEVDGDVSGDYSNEKVTVATTVNPGKVKQVSAAPVTDLGLAEVNTKDTFVIVANKVGSHSNEMFYSYYVTNNDVRVNDDKYGLEMSGVFGDNACWTITKVEGGYTISNGSKYVNIDGNNKANLLDEPVVLQMNVSDGVWAISRTIEGTTYYLNYFNSFGSASVTGHAAAVWQSNDDGSKWKLYQVEEVTCDGMTTYNAPAIPLNGLENGADYLILNANQFYNNNVTRVLTSERSGEHLQLNSSGTTTSFADNAVWTLEVDTTTSNSVSGWLKNGDNYLLIEGSADSGTTNTTTEKSDAAKVTIQAGSNTDLQRTAWRISNGSTHLNDRGSWAGTYNDNNDNGNHWYFYKVARPTGTTTTITFTAVQAGETEITIGETTYTVNVSEPEPTVKYAQVLSGNTVLALNECEYVLGGTEGAYSLCHGGNYYVNLRATSVHCNQTTTASAFLNLDWDDYSDERVSIWQNTDRLGYLYFHYTGDPKWNVNGELAGDNTGFYLLYADEESTNTDIPGYTVADAEYVEAHIEDGESYLIAVKNSLGNWYVMVPATSSTANNCIAQVVATNAEIHEHTFGDPTTTNATCSTPGAETVTCTTENCGHVHKTVIPATGHLNTKVVGQKDATLNETGYTGDTVCTDCGATTAKGTVIPVLTGAVAQINDTKYASLAEAVAAAEASNTILLLADTTEDIVLDKPVLLDLQNNTLNGQILVKADVSVNNGTVYAANKDAIVIGVKDNEKDDTIVLAATDLTVTSDTDCAVLIYDGSATFNSSSLTSNSANYAAIQGSGNQFGNITLNSTTVTSANEVAIYWPHVGRLATFGGAITGSTGLYIKLGTAELSGTEITGNGAKVAHTTNGNGGDSTGDAITVDTGATAPVVNMTGVTLNSTNSNLVGIYGGTVTLNGANLNATRDAFRIEAGKLIITSGVVTAGECAVYIRGGDVEVNGGSLTSTSTDYAAIQGNGNCGGNLTVTAGTIKNENEVAIYWPGSGNLTVTGGKVEGTTGIYAKQGNVTISGGYIKGTGAKVAYNHNGNGGDSTGDALVLESCDYGTLTAKITDGEFVSTNASAVAAYAQTGYTELTGFVSGGVFSSKVEESYCAEGYIPTDADANGNYGVKEGTYVAQVGETKYESLAEAVAAAPAGSEVKLLANTNGDGIIIDKNITIDLGGYTYTIDGVLVGSAKTKSNGFQILKDNDVTIKNGTIVMDDAAVRGHDMQTGNNYVIQNYADLTLDGVTVTGNTHTSYVVSINSGDVKIIGSTSINAEGKVAFDVYESSSYTAPTVTVDTTGTITGEIEVTGGTLTLNAGTFNSTLDYQSGSVTKAENVTLDAPEGYEWENDTTLVKSKLTIYKTSMTMANSLNMNFAFAQSYVDDWTGYYAIIVKDYADGSKVEQKVMVDTKKSATIDGIACYYVTFTGIAAKEMTDELHVTIYNAAGEAVSKVYTDTVRGHAMRDLANNVSDLNNTMVVDMLNYGTEAQNNASYNLDNLANGELSEEQKAFATKTVEYENKMTFTGEGKYLANVKMLSNIQFMMAFSGIEQPMKAVVTYTDWDGKAKEVSIDGSEIVKDGSYYVITIEETVIADGRCDINCKVYDSNNTVVAEVTDSIASYASRTTKTPKLYEAIMKFSDSAKAYLESK